MSPNHDYIAYVILQHLKGQLSVEEHEFLETWKSESEENAALVEKVKTDGYVPSGLRKLIAGQVHTTTLLMQHGVPIDAIESDLQRTLLNVPRSNDLPICYDDAMSWMSNEELKRVLQLRCAGLTGMPAYDFYLYDTNDNLHRLADYKGKIIVLDFWFTGCGNCVDLTPKLKLVEEKFNNNSEVVFISISSDINKNVWMNSIKGGKYTTSDEQIKLYTRGRGEQDPLYEGINFQGAPTLKLIDKDGNWCQNPVDCRVDNGADLIAKIEAELAKDKK